MEYSLNFLYRIVAEGYFFDYYEVAKIIHFFYFVFGKGYFPQFDQFLYSLKADNIVVGTTDLIDLIEFSQRFDIFNFIIIKKYYIKIF